MITWLQGNLLWPTLQSMAGAVILAAAIGSINQATTLISGCPNDVAATIGRGEKALAEGDTTRALAFAEDGLSMSPRGTCANALAAAAEIRAMQDRVIARDAAGAETYRARCYRHANQAMPLLGRAPRVEAIREMCRAV